jgi:hypothetical protein
MSVQDNLDSSESSPTETTTANGFSGCASHMLPPSIAGRDTLSARDLWVMKVLKQLSKEAYELKVFGFDCFEPYQGDTTTMMLAGQPYSEIHTALVRGPRDESRTYANNSD